MLRFPPFPRLSRRPGSALHALRQPLSALPRDARDTLFLLGVIAAVIAPQWARLPRWAALLAAGLLLWRGWLAWCGRPLPGRWPLAALLLAALAATLYTHQTLLQRDAGVTLIVLLLALKMLELRARRDALVVFFLGFFTLLSNFFHSQSLPTAAAMLLALLGLLAALVNAHMPVGRPPLVQSLRTAVRLALLGAPVMAALFLLFPRMAPLWGSPGESSSGRSGLGNAMTMGAITELALDDRVALRLRFAPRAGAGQGDARPDTPPQNQLYFRGPVFGAFDGSQWRPLVLRFGEDPVASPGASANLQLRGAPVRYEVLLEPQRQPWLLLLDAAGARPQLAGAPEFDVFMTPDLQWLASRPVSELLRYRATSHPHFSHGPAEWGPSLRAYTALPQEMNPRTIAWAQQLRSQHQIGARPTGAQAGALIDAALTRLRSGGYVYTLEPGRYGAHSADEFWFERKQGFCEHIASAFVVLMRALQIPARIVTGYQGGERNPVDGLWTVRQSDAHAWAEVWVAGRGWLRVDPTGAVAPGRVGAFERLQAPQGAFAAAMGTVISPGLVQTLRSAWEAVNSGWNQWVLNYTQSRQFDLLKSLGFESPDWQDLGTLLGLLVAACALVGAGWSLWERNRSDPWLRLLARARQRLARAGLLLPENLPPRAIAQRLQAWQAEQAARAAPGAGNAAAPQAAALAALSDWLLRLERLRYARPQAGANAGGLRQLRRELRSLRWPGARRR